MSRRLQIRAGLAVLTVGLVWLVWAVWPRPSDEELVRRVFATVAEAIADGRYAPVRDAIDDQYTDSMGNRKEAILNLLRALTPLNPEKYVIEYDSIRVSFTDAQSARADIQGNLIIMTRRTDATIQTIPATVAVHLRKSEGRWRIFKAEGWQSAAEQAGAGHFGPN